MKYGDRVLIVKKYDFHNGMVGILLDGEDCGFGLEYQVGFYVPGHRTTLAVKKWYNERDIEATKNE